MSNKTDRSTIVRTIVKLRQGRRLTHILRTNGPRVRVIVEFDLYDEQSYGLVECWNGSWVQIHRMSGYEISRDHGRRPDASSDRAFAEVETELLRVAFAVLGIEP